MQLSGQLKRSCRSLDEDSTGRNSLCFAQLSQKLAAGPKIRQGREVRWRHTGEDSAGLRKSKFWGGNGLAGGRDRGNPQAEKWEIALGRKRGL